MRIQEQKLQSLNLFEHTSLKLLLELLKYQHLEPLGFIKFDILGVASLAMMEDCISSILTRHFDVPGPKFKDIKDFYNKNLHPDVIDTDNQKIYEKVYRGGEFPGIFQLTKEGAPFMIIFDLILLQVTMPTPGANPRRVR